MHIKVTYESGNQTIAFAAQELRRYLERMLCGHEGSVRVALAVRCECDTDMRESFAVDMTPSGGSITGGGPRAVLLGVYDCLRALGCRFLGPGGDMERIARIAPEALAVRYEKRADFACRGVCIEGANSLENILEYIRWLPKAGYNTFFAQFKTPYAFLKRWYRHENNPLCATEPYGEADAERGLEDIVREVKRRGLVFHGVGHGWTGEVLGCSALSWDAQTLELPEEKRPLAAEVDGVRGLFRGVPANTNLCLSNLSARSAFAQRVADYAQEHTDTDYLHVWLADEYNNVCECENCRRDMPSDLYVELLNEIDRLLTRRGLNTRIVFLLYQELLWPPVKARLENPERFVMMFAPISRSFESSYEMDGQERALPKYVRNRVTLPRDIGENLSFLRAWQKVFDGAGFAYDYHLGRAHYGDFGYIHISRIISADIKKLRGMGLSGSISCQELRAAWPNALPNYVMGYTLFDESADADSLIDEYFEAAYGGAAQTVKEYLTRLSELNCCDYVNGAGERENPMLARRMAGLQGVCADFESEEKKLDASNLFVRLLACHRQYTLHLARALELLARGESERAAAAWRELRDFICENEPEYQPYLDVYRVLDVTEKFTGFPVGGTVAGVTIRRENTADFGSVYALVKAAFESAEHSDGNEHELVGKLRRSGAYIPELSLVAEKDGRIAGHIMFTKARIGTQTQLVLAPLSVLPEYQRQGIGTALIKHGHELAAKLGYGYSVVLGSERYYPRSGYRPAVELGIKPPFDVPAENFMACKLRADAQEISGTVKYADEFEID